MAQIGAAYTAMFAHMSADALRDLEGHREPSVAIRAAWEMAKRAVLNTAKPGDTAVGPAPLERFIGFVEGRLQVAVPQPWANSIASAHVGAYRRVGFRESTAVPVFSDELGVWLWPGLTIKIGDPCQIAADASQASVSRASINRLCKDHGETVWRAFIRNGSCYIVVFNSMGIVSELLRVNAATGDDMWRANTWGTGWMFWQGRGEPHYYVGVVETCGTVYVFGSGAGGAVIEGYDTKSGAAVLRFETADWQEQSLGTVEAEANERDRDQ